MSSSSKPPTFLQLFGLYLVCSAALLLTYTGQIGEANAYMGMQPWDMSFAGYISLILGLPVLALIVSQSEGRPSDFFRLFYGSITVISFLVLHPVTGHLSPAEIFTGFVILFLPLLMIHALDVAVPNIRITGLLSPFWVESIVVLLLLSVVAAAAMNAPASAGFGLDISYDRRLEGREVYGAGSLLAYGLSIAMNGLTPYLAFRAGLRRQFHMIVLALAAVMFFYWLLGVKAPLAYVVVALGMGFLTRRRKVSSFGYYFFGGVIFLGLVVLVEWALFDGYSLVADYFFRRLFTVQAEVQDYYLKFLAGDKTVPWSWLYGSTDRDFAATYYIGGHYLGNDETNANTNAFLYQLAAKGLIGYIYALFIVPLVLLVFDRLHRSTRNPSYLFLGFLYGLLVVEQAYTVALVSSGVILLFFLSLLEVEHIPRTASTF